MNDQIEKLSDGKFTTTDGYVHASIEDAQDWITRRNEYFAAMRRMQNVGLVLSADEYAALCAQENVSQHTDTKIEDMTYGLKYGEFEPKPVSRWQGQEYRGATTAKYVEMCLASARLRGIEAERAAQQTDRQPRQPDYPNGRKLDCGHVVYWANEGMSASLGRHARIVTTA